MTERKMVLDHKFTLDFEYRTIDSVIDMLMKIKENHGGDTMIDYGHVYNYDEREYLHYITMRPETDEEMEIRINKERKWEEERIEHDLKLLKQLKEKYGE